jgi:hypothetical protein
MCDLPPGRGMHRGLVSTLGRCTTLPTIRRVLLPLLLVGASTIICRGARSPALPFPTTPHTPSRLANRTFKTANNQGGGTASMSRTKPTGNLFRGLKAARAMRNREPNEPSVRPPITFADTFTTNHSRAVPLTPPRTPPPVPPHARVVQQRRWTEQSSWSPKARVQDRADPPQIKQQLLLEAAMMQVHHDQHMQVGAAAYNHADGGGWERPRPAIELDTRP